MAFAFARTRSTHSASSCSDLAPGSPVGLYWENRERGGGGADRAIALPLFCWDLFSRAPVDQEKVIVELLDFSLKGGRLEPVVFDESLTTMQFLWMSGIFACPNDYNPMCVQG